MAQYIDKSALVAEIERRRESNAKERFFGRLVEDNCILDFLNTLEVKEVDLEKEIEEHTICMPMSEFTHDSEAEDFYEWAREEFRYFFKLGMNASNPLTWEDIKTIQNISGEVYAEVAKGKDDFYSIYPTEQSFLEEVLKRFKAQKGEEV